MTDEEVQQQSIGQQLREARDKKKLSPNEVATQLNLHPKIVAALESDDIENLPPPTFARGYLRAYAKLLELDGEGLVEIYNQVGPSDPELVSAYEPEKQTQSSHPIVRWATLLIIVTISTLLGFWWYGPRQVEEQSIADTRESTALEAEVVAETNESDDDSNTLVITNEVVVPEQGETEVVENVDIEQPSAEVIETVVVVESEPPAEPEEPEPAANPTFVSSSVVRVDELASNADAISRVGSDNQTSAAVSDATNEDDSVDVTLLNAISSPANASEVPVSNTVVEAPTTVETTGAVVESIDDISVTRDAIGDDTMVLRTETESWAEVIDANDARLMYGMLTRGEPVTLKGTAPFQVFLGNTPGISITVNDQSLPTPTYNNINNTSRFNVSSDGSYNR